MISLLLPTRLRPDGLRRLAESAADTASDPDGIELVTYHDNDDPAGDLYRALHLPIRWRPFFGPREHDGVVNLSVKWNWCYDVCCGDILMHCGDDIVFRTPGWDAVVREAFDSVPDKILFAYGDDLYQPHTFGTHGFVHRRWVEVTGTLFPPFYESDFNDTYLNDISQAIGRHRFIPIVTEHMHWCAGKAQQDLNTIERLARHAAHRPQDIYYGEKGQITIRDAVSRLQEYIDTGGYDGGNPTMREL